MTNAQQNLETVRAGYAAFAAGDLSTVADALAPGIRWHMAGNSSLAGTYQGHDAVFAYLAKLMELTGGTYAVEVRDLIASDEHVVALVRETARRGDTARLDANEAHVWRMADGLADEFWGYRLDGDAVDTFWS